MASYVNLLFIAELAGCAAVLFILFYAYGSLAKRYVSLLGGIDGGFITFLAIHELLALPFILFHFSFALFYVLFLLLNVPMLIYGLAKVLKNRSQLLDRRIGWTYMILAAAALVICIGLTQYFVKYEADDSLYVSLVQQNKDNSRLYSYDPSTGDPALHFSSAYAFESWELLETSFAKNFNMSALELTHGLMPIVTVALVFAAGYRIYKNLLKDKRLACIALFFLGILLVFGGYSGKSQGTFILSRGWLGKAIISSFIIPLLLYALSKLYYRPHNKQLYAYLLAINVASVALNPSAIFINFAAITIFGILVFIKHRNIRSLLCLFITMVPILATGVAELYFKHFAHTVNGSQPNATNHLGYSYYLHTFVGSSWYFYWLPVVLALLYFKRANLNKKFWIMGVVFPVVLLLTYLNPIFITTVKRAATENTYWRLMWLVPITIILPIAGAYIYNLSIKRIPSKRTFYRAGAGMAALVVASGILIASGEYLFDTSKPLFAYDNTRQKVPPGVVGVGEYFKGAPSGKVLAATDAAAYLHTFTSKHTLLVARTLSLPAYYLKTSTDYKNRVLMFNAVNGTNLIPTTQLHDLLKEYKVDYLVYPVSNTYAAQYVSSFDLPILYSNQTYKVAKASGTSPVD